MTIAAGTTATFTADSAGWTVVVTPAGGAAVTCHTTFDGGPHILSHVINDDIAGAPVVTRLNQLITGATQKSGGNAHIKA